MVREDSPRDERHAVKEDALVFIVIVRIWARLAHEAALRAVLAADEACHVELQDDGGTADRLESGVDPISTGQRHRDLGTVQRPCPRRQDTQLCPPSLLGF